MSKIIKYNPSFLNDDEIIKSFVVRQQELALVLETITENTHHANQHMLIIGARGSGKTTLLRRTAAAIRENSQLNEAWFPLPFGEECYEVASAGQFWHEALHYLGVQTGDPKWNKAYIELLQEPDEIRLGQRSLALLLDFADSQKKRIVLMVENLDLVLGEQLNTDDGWALRKILMDEKRIMLLGSAVTRFDAITQEDKAMFELFRILDLSRLSISDCQAIWKNIAGKDIHTGQARAIQILTGGSPRLLTILAIFGADRSFHCLLEDLSLLVDEHTDYFKSNFEHLPPTERKVFACLATLWQDSTAAEIAQAARMTTNQVSSLLKRLTTRGIVEVLNGKKKKYQLSERLYNIYYLMRRGHENHRVCAVVNFMLHFYGDNGAFEAFNDIAQEACVLERGKRDSNFTALRYLTEHSEIQKHLAKNILPQQLFQLEDTPRDLKETLLAYFDFEAAYNENRWESIIEYCQRHRELYGDTAETLFRLGDALFWQHKFKESISFLQKSLELDPKNIFYWSQLGQVYMRCILTQEENEEQYKYYYNEGIQCLRNAVAFSQRQSLIVALLASYLSFFHEHIEEAQILIKEALKNTTEIFIYGIAADTYSRCQNTQQTLYQLQRYFSSYEKDTRFTLASASLSYLLTKNYGEEILQAMEQSHFAKNNEAWIVAIKLYLGHEVQAPQEVREVASDILHELKALTI